MALFRPYEQGKREPSDTEPSTVGNPSTTADAEAAGRAGSSGSRLFRRSRGGATAVSSAQEATARQASGATGETGTTTPRATTPASSAPASVAASGTAAARGPRVKQGPTPSRRQAEQARMERLHPTLTKKEQRAVSREHERVARQKQFDAVENSPGRTLVRDFVDARWTIVEFMVPTMILMMALSMAASLIGPRLLYTLTILTYVLFFAAIINITILWFSFRKELQRRHPGTPPRGLLMYLINRAMWIRRFRRPAPRINRGDSY